MIYVHLADGFEEIEAVTIIDVLRRGELNVESVSITGKKSVKGAHAISVDADRLYEEANYETCEMIVLPGGMPGTTNLCAHDRLIKHIQAFSQNDKYLAAICAAPMVLAKAGVLTGKKATIFPGMENHLIGARLLGDRVVVDGTVITSSAPGTAMEFAVKLVEILKGKEKAIQLRKSMVME